MTVKINADTTDGLKLVSDTSGAIDFQKSGTTQVSIDTNGNIGAGTSSPTHLADAYTTIEAKGTDTNGSGVILATSTAGIQTQVISSDASGIGTIGTRTNHPCTFSINNAEKMRIATNGDVLVGTTDNEPWNNGAGNSGFAVKANGRVAMAAPDTSPLFVNRVTSDGRLVDFLQDGTTEGEITVSGSTVSYNGGHLARWGRLPSGEVDNTILKGTVMSNLDEMVVWSYDDVLYTEEDELPEGKSVGDVKKPAYTAENEQRNQLKVSNVEGDINVAGLFVAWRNESDNYNDIGLAMTGDMVIRIAQGTTVQRGDLLISAGDGTAKPQGDDIVRSKTVAKVISTTVIKTYDDNSYLVPCVVMAC